MSPAPASAAPAPISIVSVSAENVQPGDTVRVRFRVTNPGSATEAAIVVVGGGLRCKTGCRAEPSLAPGQSRNLEATVVAPAASPGETSGLNISVAVRLGGENHFAFKMVYVHGSGASSPRPPAEVARVSGRVRDADGKTISGAALTIRDSAGHKYRTTSGDNGQFSIRPTAAKPIAAGSITVVAALDGYRTARKTLTARAGDTANALLTLTAVPTPVKATPSPTPSRAVAEADEPETAAPETSAPTLQAVSNEGGPSPLFLLLGGLLIAVGLGALALVLIRRRHATS
ncbi:carboxypeptidase regulatory-like domain-containing protein [Actinoplanes sp. LDG1-01]|uniref:alpha-amylase n=2 Tax=Paractinoplanes lichenicola TaxID=2802976 RepID=A0ABS1VWJ1_9ACTN|nr:carboxypeptidase regulatory-like domain-containing protein [Actinoplanes lichenicola]